MIEQIGRAMACQMLDSKSQWATQCTQETDPDSIHKAKAPPTQKSASYMYV